MLPEHAANTRARWQHHAGCVPLHRRGQPAAAGGRGGARRSRGGQAGPGSAAGPARGGVRQRAAAAGAAGAHDVWGCRGECAHVLGGLGGAVTLPSLACRPRLLWSWRQPPLHALVSHTQEREMAADLAHRLEVSTTERNAARAAAAAAEGRAKVRAVLCAACRRRHTAVHPRPDPGSAPRTCCRHHQALEAERQQTVSAAVASAEASKAAAEAKLKAALAEAAEAAGVCE